MSRKKVEVVELNKKKEEIILAEKQSPLLLFFRRHGIILFLTALILSLTILGVSLMMIIKNMNLSEEPIIKEASVDLSIGDYTTTVGNNSLTSDTAKSAFLNSGKFKQSGEILLVKKVERNAYTIKYFSDGTALKIMNSTGNATRIKPLSDGKYGINDEGIISSKAEIIDLIVTKTKKYAWGVVNFYDDGSADVVDSKMDIFVRNANDIDDNYISNNKVSYLKETKNIGNVKLNYYYDGTIEVIKDNKSYLVRNNDDLIINNNNVTFKNNNQSVIYDTKKMSNGIIIDYYDDGGAIIRDGDKTLSVRKSNSIIIKDNNIYEIVDNIYVDISKKKDNVTYYTNGSAVVDNYNGETLYIPENSNIKYQNGNILTVGNDKEKLSNETNVDDENVKTFEKTGVVKTKDYIAIVPKDKIIYDQNGNVKDIKEDILDEDIDGFTITNNSNEKIKYRVVLEQSLKTTINVDYLRFQLSSKSKYVEPTTLVDKIWKQDRLAKELNVTGINYVLLESTLEPLASDNISLMLWTDYDTIPNSEQDKYFYGTVRVYAWTED